MEKHELKQEGLQALLSQLYALTDAELFVKAAALAADFKAWMEAHFILNDVQLNFLNSLDEAFVGSIARDSSDFLQQRLPIVLSKQELSATEEEEKPRGKIIEVAKKISTDNSNFFLSFTISYPLLG